MTRYVLRMSPKDETSTKKSAFSSHALWALTSECLYLPLPWASNTAVIVTDSDKARITDSSLKEAGIPYLKRTNGGVTFHLVGGSSLPLGALNGQFRDEDELFAPGGVEDKAYNEGGLPGKNEKRGSDQEKLFDEANDPEIEEEELAEERHSLLVDRYKLALSEMRMASQLLIPMLEESTIFDSLVPPNVKPIYLYNLRKLVNQLDCEYLQSPTGDVTNFDPPDYATLDLLFCRLSFALREACLDFARHMKKHNSANGIVSYPKAFSTLNSAIQDAVVCATLMSYLRSNSDLLQARFAKATAWMDELILRPSHAIFDKDLLTGEKEAQGRLTGEVYLQPNNAPLTGWMEAEIEMESVYNVPDRVDIAELLGIYETLRQHQMVVVSRILENRDSDTPLSKDQEEQIALMLRVLQAQACGIPLASLPPAFAAGTQQTIGGLGSLGALFGGLMGPGTRGDAAAKEEVDDMDILIEEEDGVDLEQLMKQSEEHTKQLAEKQREMAQKKMQDDIEREKSKLDKEKRDLAELKAQLEKQKKEGSGGSSASDASSASGSDASNASGSNASSDSRTG